MLCVSENFAKLLKIMQNYTAEYGMCKFLLVLNCNVVSTLYHSRDTNHLIMACHSNFGGGHSTSLKLAPFDIPYMTFHLSAIVHIALSCTIFGIFDIEEDCDPEI